MSLVIIGVDPGDSTGVGIFKDTELWHVFQGEPGDALTLIELTIGRFHDGETKVAIACERFVSQGGRGRTHQPTAQRAGGVIEHMAEQHGVHFRWQGPADAWAIASNERLKLMGMLQTGESVKQPDAKDVNMAIRHALLYMSSTYARTFHAILRAHGIM
jgi:hypothetical protein